MPAAPDTVAPLGDREADALFAPLSGYSRLAIGVSGGADSTALLYLLHRWGQRRQDSPALTALTVDHGLRPEAEREAQAVAAYCAGLGIPHMTLRWGGDKPQSGIQAKARAARRWLMSDAARDVGAQALVLAHHLDDQAETFLIRLTHGSQIFGLAGMRAHSSWYGLPVLRPFLGIPKARLVAMLRDAGIAWCEDPSNEDPGYERVRFRKLMPALAREGLTADRLARAAHLFGRMADAVDARVTRVLERAEFHAAGPVRLKVTDVSALPEDLRYRLLARLIRAASGSDYMPAHEKLVRAAAGLLALPGAKRTLGGAVIARKGDFLFVWREAGREGIEPVEIGEEAKAARAVFDDRYLVEAGKSCRLRVAPLGKGGLKRLDLKPPAGWPAAAFEAAPLILFGDGDVRVPGFCGCGLPEGCSILSLQSPLQP
ncbi:tRNA lysidine(34) synthetase TilS [Stappia sp. F7233]|uniref:tRNA(Ile)-lysidine synthase n=1 Tax=Stappia albiluteola TaxID=2758565 RepID=A0A839ADZ5_9HYPH|nr:tRNA lysidine(34) synthetase TilS [Stappia albiluteola]MBA5777258.1 tRNA lysidine(34) synthetase TilS [Stappia albiluteola]